MGTKQALQEVDPLCLPVGQTVGPWRVKSWRGRGAYGTLYRVEHEEGEEEGEFALKLAIQAGDERFEREAELLRRITHPSVPRFRAKGVWEHPDGAFPYVVMEWVEGARSTPGPDGATPPLARSYGCWPRWRGRWRPRMRRAECTGTLTSKLLPPATPAYRTPEAWAFLNAFKRHPTAHYPASACDDLFALGATAYRLVTDEYPPLTQPGEMGSEVWSEGGPGARPVRELNPRVSPELEAIIQRLLAIAPEERFGGRAREAAEALERAAEGQGPELDEHLFIWCDEHRPRFRSLEGARLVEEQDAVARQEHALREAEVSTRVRVGRQQAPPPQVFMPVWRTMVGMVLLSGLIAAGVYRRQQVTQDSAKSGSGEGGRVAVGDSTEPVSPPMRADDTRQKIGLPMPEEPLPNQRKPPCTRRGELELRGGCWYALRDAAPPCSDNSYEWKGACYVPSEPPRRQPAARPP